MTHGAEAGGMPPDEFSASVKNGIAKREKVVTFLGARG
jgi:hypothetical protein